MLLEANYLGLGTGGGSLGLQPNTGSAVLSREVLVAQLDVPAFSTVLERFISLTEDWTKRLQAAESEPAANTYAPPPQGGHPRLIRTGALFLAPFDHPIADWITGLLRDLLVWPMD